MKLLICTQALDKDHPVLGFFHRWVEEFAKHCEVVHVVCLEKGKCELPANVFIHSLGKEEGRSRLKYLWRFFRHIWILRKDYDSVFVHMNQVYVILGGWLWRAWGKQISLWYAHGSVSLSLKLALLLTHQVVTSTPEGFRFLSDKVRVVGQGIDTRLFQPCSEGYQENHIRIIYVGRISPIKRCEVLVEAAARLAAAGKSMSVTLVGDIQAPETQEYYSKLKELVSKSGLDEQVRFTGAVPNHALSSYLCAADVFANPSVTGSLDKAGLEAIASGVPVITCNEAYAGVLGNYANRLMFPKGNPVALANAIAAVHLSPDRQQIIDNLMQTVRSQHSIETLITRILTASSFSPGQ